MCPLKHCWTCNRILCTKRRPLWPILYTGHYVLDNCTYGMCLSHHGLTSTFSRGSRWWSVWRGRKGRGGSLTPPVPRQDLPVAITSIVASGGAWRARNGRTNKAYGVRAAGWRPAAGSCCLRHNFQVRWQTMAARDRPEVARPPPFFSVYGAIIS